MERAGTSVDNLQSGMKSLSSQAQANAKEFQQLGISEQEVATLSKEDLFGKVIEGLSGMEDGTERTALATKLLGKSATELGPLLNEGTAAIEEQRQMAEKYGLVMSDEAVKASAEFKDSLTTLNGTMRGLGNRMMSEFLPAATKVSDGLALMFTGDIDGGIESISSGITEITGKIQDAIPVFLENGGKFATALMDGLVENMPAIMEGLTSVLMAIIDSLPTFIPQLLTAAGILFMGIVQAIPSIVGHLLSALGSLIGQGVDAIKGFAGDMMNAAGDLLQGLIDGLWNSAGDVANALWDIARNAVDSFKSFFGIASPSRLMREMGGYIGQGLALGIEGSSAVVGDAMDGLMNTAYGKARTIGIGIDASNSGRATNADVVGAVNALHRDLGRIIEQSTPDGMTSRQFGRAVKAYA